MFFCILLAGFLGCGLWVCILSLIWWWFVLLAWWVVCTCWVGLFVLVLVWYLYLYWFGICVVGGDYVLLLCWGGFIVVVYGCILAVAAYCYIVCDLLVLWGGFG